METEREQAIKEDARRQLIQVALELEVAANAAKEAATNIDDRQLCWTYMQQLFARMESATAHLEELRTTVDEGFTPDE